MIRRRIYLQLCAILAASLLAFAILAAVASWALGRGKFERALFHKTTTLAVLLLPPATASKQDHMKALLRVSKALDFRITLWSEDQDLIASTGASVDFPSVNPQPGVWIPAQGRSTYVTKFRDGRRILVELDRLERPSDESFFGFTLLLLAVVIAAITYPFVARLTGRIERLQATVMRMGDGDLGTRIQLEGDDEIALLARSFNEAAERIEELVTAQRMVLAHASHELRTPLARIRLGIEMLGASAGMERIASMQQDIRDLNELIDDLILMARVDSGFEPSLHPIDVLALVAEEAARYPDCKVSGESSEALGDWRLLQHVVRNLIDNAYKHGSPPVRVEVTQKPDCVEIAVYDQGMGIPESEHENVFRPFYRRAEGTPGHGLGLSLVRKIAEQHGGRVIIRTKPSSAVIVTLRSKGPIQSGVWMPPNQARVKSTGV